MMAAVVSDRDPTPKRRSDEYSLTAVAFASTDAPTMRIAVCRCRKRLFSLQHDRSLPNFDNQLSEFAFLSAATFSRYLSGSALMLFSQLLQQMKTASPLTVNFTGVPIPPNSSSLTGQTF